MEAAAPIILAQEAPCFALQRAPRGTLTDLGEETKQEEESHAWISQFHLYPCSLPTVSHVLLKCYMKDQCWHPAQWGLFTLVFPGEAWVPMMATQSCLLIDWKNIGEPK